MSKSKEIIQPFVYVVLGCVVAFWEQNCYDLLSRVLPIIVLAGTVFIYVMIRFIQKKYPTWQQQIKKWKDNKTQEVTRQTTALPNQDMMQSIKILSETVAANQKNIESLLRILAERSDHRPVHAVTPSNHRHSSDRLHKNAS